MKIWACTNHILYSVDIDHNLVGIKFEFLKINKVSPNVQNINGFRLFIYLCKFP